MRFIIIGGGGSGGGEELDSPELGEMESKSGMETGKTGRARIIHSYGGRDDSMSKMSLNNHLPIAMVDYYDDYYDYYLPQFVH